MAKKKVYRAVCLRDTIQDNPYQYFKAGLEYTISEDSPVAVHFKRLESSDDGGKTEGAKDEK